MARIALVCPDLLFGSNLQGARRAAGPEPVAAGDEQSAAAGLPRLGFYSHVEQDVRRRAEQAGFERVVPRSRMAREAAALVDALLAAS